MKRLITIFSTLSLVSIIFAQGLDTLSAKSYGGPNFDTGCPVQATSDSGFIVVGEITSIGGM